MHTAMAEQNVDTLIVTGLDETACRFIYSDHWSFQLNTLQICDEKIFLFHFFLQL